MREADVRMCSSFCVDNTCECVVSADLYTHLLTLQK